MKWILGLGDKQFPMADLTYVSVDAETSDEAKAKARTTKTWAFVMSCLPADSSHFLTYPTEVSEHLDG